MEPKQSSFKVDSGADGVLSRDSHHDSPLGRIVSNWRKQDGRLVMEITVPPGAVAKVYVPARTAAGVTESGRPAAQSEGVRLLREEPSSTLFETASGCYEFSVRAD